MKPARFDYYDPRTFEEAVELLGGAGADAKVMAGGKPILQPLGVHITEAPATPLRIWQAINQGEH